MSRSTNWSAPALADLACAAAGTRIDSDWAGLASAGMGLPASRPLTAPVAHTADGEDDRGERYLSLLNR